MLLGRLKMANYSIENRVSSTKVNNASKGNPFSLIGAKTSIAFLKDAVPTTIKNTIGSKTVTSGSTSECENPEVIRTQGQLFP